MRAYKRGQHVDGINDTTVLDAVDLTEKQVEEMYRYMAIANYEDRFVIPTAHREQAMDAFSERGGCGFSFGDGCSNGTSDLNLFGTKKTTEVSIGIETIKKYEPGVRIPPVTPESTGD